MLRLGNLALSPPSSCSFAHSDLVAQAAATLNEVPHVLAINDCLFAVNHALCWWLLCGCDTALLHVSAFRIGFLLSSLYFISFLKIVVASLMPPKN